MISLSKACQNHTVNTAIDILEVSLSSDELRSNHSADKDTEIDILEVSMSSDDSQQVNTFDQ